MSLFAVLIAAALTALGWGIYKSGSALAAIVIGIILLVIAIMVWSDAVTNRGRDNAGS